MKGWHRNLTARRGSPCAPDDAARSSHASCPASFRCLSEPSAWSRIRRVINVVSVSRASSGRLYHCGVGSDPAAQGGSRRSSGSRWRSARHEHLPGLPIGSSMLRPNLAVPMACRYPPPRRSAPPPSSPRVAIDATGADLRCQDWLVARSNMHAGISSQRSVEMPVRLQRNAGWLAFSTTSWT